MVVQAKDKTIPFNCKNATTSYKNTNTENHTISSAVLHSLKMKGSVLASIVHRGTFNNHGTNRKKVFRLLNVLR